MCEAEKDAESHLSVGERIMHSRPASDAHVLTQETVNMLDHKAKGNVVADEIKMKSAVSRI